MNAIRYHKLMSEHCRFMEGKCQKCYLKMVCKSNPADITPMEIKHILKYLRDRKNWGFTIPHEVLSDLMHPISSHQFTSKGGNFYYENPSTMGKDKPVFNCIRAPGRRAGN